MIEIQVLEVLGKADKKNDQPIVKLLDWFDFRGHICMIFPKYGLSVFDFLKKNHYRPFILPHIKHISKQVLQSVAFMHECELVHTDLKPENILFKDSDYYLETDTTSAKPRRIPKNTEIALIDFGSATFENQYHTTVVSTRHYRAPEVILGLGWSYPCDVWSVGCILVELLTGEALFQTHHNVEHLAMMEKVFGKIPNDIIDKSDKHTIKYFDELHNLRWPELMDNKPSTIRHVKDLLRLEDLILDKDFYDLLRNLLTYETCNRITAQKALEHPFFFKRIFCAYNNSSSRKNWYSSFTDRDQNKV